MKKTLITIGLINLILLSPLVSNAQNNKGMELSDTQKEQLMKLNSDKQYLNLSPEAKRQAYWDNLKKVLTPEQWESIQGEANSRHSSSSSGNTTSSGK